MVNTCTIIIESYLEVHIPCTVDDASSGADALLGPGSLPCHIIDLGDSFVQ